MSKKSGRIISKRKDFAQVSNEPLRSNDLSLKAKGLYALIESYINIPNFELYKNTLKKACKEGSTSFENTWKELKESGYLVQRKYKNESDGYFYYEYELKYSLNVHTPETYPLDNAGSGKGGVYNNTNLNNTYLNNTYLLGQAQEEVEINEETSLYEMNNNLDTGRKKISKENYLFVSEILNMYEVDKNNSIPLVEEYKKQIPKGNRSLEHFAKVLPRLIKEVYP